MQNVQRVDRRMNWTSKIGAVLLWTLPWLDLNLCQRGFHPSYHTIGTHPFSSPHHRWLLADRHSLHNPACPTTRQLEPRRLHHLGSTPCRLPLCHQKLPPFPPLGPWERLRKTQFCPSLGRPWVVSHGSHSWLPLDQESPDLGVPDHWAAERDVWCRCSRSALCDRDHVCEAREDGFLRVFLRRSVSF